MIVLLAPNAPRDEPAPAPIPDLPLDTTMMIAEMDRAVVRFQQALAPLSRQPQATDDDDDDAITWHDAEWQ